MTTFSAALLVGGQSTRMGCDKALLPWPGPDRVLWRRQLSILEELQPEQIFWSGPLRPGVPEHVITVEDAVKAAGPLAGISACLQLLPSELLVVLAVDMPEMNAAFLRRMLATCSPGCGAVARHGDFFEPLAAVYPKEIAPLATKQLEANRLALQDFMVRGIETGVLRSISVASEDRALLRNLNEPRDLSKRGN